MNTQRIIKSSLGIVLVFGIVLLLCGWGPVRKEYTLDEINNGTLGSQITFNSISDNPHIGHEFNFVGARENSGKNLGLENLWSDEINVEEGKSYFIRMYVHNNSPLGEEAMAENVRAYFDIPTEMGNEIEVNGLIEADNAVPSSIWDNVIFKNDRKFSLLYIPDSATMAGNAGMYYLDNSIVNESWVTLGYNSLDGKIPGCFQYDQYITILVEPQFEDSIINTNSEYDIQNIYNIQNNGILNIVEGANNDVQINVTNYAPQTENGVISFFLNFTTEIIISIVGIIITILLPIMIKKRSKKKNQG